MRPLTTRNPAAGVIRGGVRPAWTLEDAYRRHGPPARARATRLLRDPALAEDVVQEVFLTLWSSPGLYEPGRGSLAPYVSVLVRGRSLDVARSRAARREREARFATENTPPIDGDPAEHLVSRRLVRAIEALPTRERAPLELAYLGGYSQAEVAGLLGLAEGTVKSRIRSALGRLRRQFRR